MNGYAGFKLLIVDDHAHNLFTLRTLIEAHMDVAVIEATSGQQAIDLTHSHPDIDLIILDVQMPEISGLEVTKWLKEDDELAHIPVVAVTAFAMKGDEERIREGGCEAYISKPISVVHFLDTIKRLLDKVPAA